MRRLFVGFVAFAAAAVACTGESSDRLPEGSPVVELSLVGTAVEGVARVELPLAGLDAYLVDEPGEKTTEPRVATGGRWFPLPTEGGATITRHLEPASAWKHGARKLPPSRVAQFRLRFRDGAPVLVEKSDGSRCTLDPAAPGADAWLVSNPFRARPVANGETWEFVLRVDLAKSLRPDGHGCFTLAPVVEVVRVASGGDELSLR